MKETFTIEGGKEMAATLRSLERGLSRKIQIDALRTAAEPLAERAGEMAPRSSAAKPHMADNIVIGAPTEKALESRGRSSETVVEVGPEMKPEDFFYSFFVEYGTGFHEAQPFMRPAFDETHKTCLDILTDELWFALRRKLPSSQERFVA